MARPTSPTERTLVLVHGYSVAASDWYDVVWGDPFAGQLGRVPAALFEALRSPRSALLFGSAQPGLLDRTEAEDTRDLAREHYVELIPVFSRRLGEEPVAVRERLERLLGEETLTTQEALNTDGEVREAGILLREGPYSELLLVSSPNHLPRCLSAALSFMEESGPGILGSLQTRASDISYGGGRAAWTCVIDGVSSSDTIPAQLVKETASELARGELSQEILTQWTARAAQ